MAIKALLTRRRVSGAGDEGKPVGDEARDRGLTVEHELDRGSIVSLDDEAQADELEASGFRVKVLPDANLLRVGGYEIDTEAATEVRDEAAGPAAAPDDEAADEPPSPAVPEELEVPAESADEWQHHLVQLRVPPDEELTFRIEERGVDVVEPVSSYGLFVTGSPEAVRGLLDLPFVQWVGPFKPAYRIAPSLRGLTGPVRYVSVGVYPPSEAEAVAQAVAQAGGTVVHTAPPVEGYKGEYARVIAEVEAEALPALARLPGVRWLEFASSVPGLDGERETQIVAENLNGSTGSGAAPVPGYQAWLADVELSGEGVVIAICDTGVSSNAANNASGHLDLRGRQVAFVNYSSGGASSDVNGHGTHVAGIAVGNAATGKKEGTPPNEFLRGQGMAPGARFVTQNALTLNPWPPSDFGRLTRDSVRNGAHVMNNSWWDGGPAGSGYTENARRFDQLVRDPDPETGALDSLVIVFSAGNAGPGPSTLTPPKEAKNPITVGNSLTFLPGIGDADDIRGIARSSSRGPARDGRLLPNVVAPGTNVSSARRGTTDDYVLMTGTSMAAPHVAGACALLIQWWRRNHGGRTPSHAMLKALLINGAEDIAGGPDGDGGTLRHIPDNNQGWGRVSVENIILDAPRSDRGPKLFSDQEHPLTAVGQEHVVRVRPRDTSRPLRVTLAWTDAPGAANASPALVNDLDLEVAETEGAERIFKGNVFADGFSATGGQFDHLNNVECVYVRNPSGVYEVSVIASALRANARPPFNNAGFQDFALVIDNAEEA
jgi:subtilisin family serine protease